MEFILFFSSDSYVVMATNWNWTYGHSSSSTMRKWSIDNLHKYWQFLLKKEFMINKDFMIRVEMISKKYLSEGLDFYTFRARFDKVINLYWYLWFMLILFP